MTGIEVRDLCVRFDQHAPVLEHCSLTVKPGEIIALLGGSGSGKSTLLRAIAKLQPVTSGEVAFTGDSPKRRAGDLAYVFQDATLLPWRTAQQNVQLPLELAGRNNHDSTRSVLKARVCEALASVGLPESSWGKYPRQLSGGMRMRVSLARAIVTDPAILLLDEPFAALDEILRNRMNELLLEIWLRKQRTILFVTHNIAEAVNLSGRLAILGGGRISRWIENPLPIPRTNEVRSSPEFARMYADVSRALNETMVVPV
ncbi:MAG: ABC transporter ATP-binding protein [Pirellulaceae bacterium]|nr:ABC transporter ATP-binding protein [Pirellulaceae bacterium]